MIAKPLRSSTSRWHLFYALAAGFVIAYVFGNWSAQCPKPILPQQAPRQVPQLLIAPRQVPQQQVPGHHDDAWDRIYELHAESKCQLDWGKVSLVMNDLRARLAGCTPSSGGFLVFGCGNDMSMWISAVPPGCKVIFLEDNQQWASQCRAAAQSKGIAAEVLDVDYRSNWKEWTSRLADTAWLGSSVPPQVSGRKWDVILVDAPFGKGAGRMKSIFWAKEYLKEGGVVFVDDLTRLPHWQLPAVETTYAHKYLGTMVQSTVGEDQNSPGILARYLPGRCPAPATSGPPQLGAASVPPPHSGASSWQRLWKAHRQGFGAGMDWGKASTVLTDIKARLRKCSAGEGLLVFGCSPDMALWMRAAGQGCNVVFVEWPSLAQEGQCATLARAQKVLPKIVTVRQPEEGAWDSSRTGLLRDSAWLGSGLPAEVQGKWDVVLVSSPWASLGHAKAVFWARQVVKEGGVVFVDDVRAPLVLSGPVSTELDTYVQACLGSPVQAVGGTTGGLVGPLRQHMASSSGC